MKYKSTKLRHEQKYIINYQEYNALKLRLTGLMKSDPHCGESGYHIRSLYFDDVYSTAYNEKQSGVEYRQKYRVRIYNKSDDMIKLERKEKYGEFISKQSFVITKDEFYNLVSGNDIGFLLKSDSEMPPQMYWAIRTKLLKPAVIVDYRRDVLICDDGNVRITFDRELQAGIDTPDIFSNVHVIDALNPDTMVLEVKYDDFLPSYIKKALQIKSQSREAVSKYVYCREMQFLHNPAARLNFII